MRGLIFATDENLKETGFGRRFFVAFTEKPYVITDAGSADVYNSQPGLDRLWKRDFSLKNAVEFRTQSDEGRGGQLFPSDPESQQGPDDRPLRE